jgi:phosphoglycerol transferase
VVILAIVLAFAARWLTDRDRDTAKGGQSGTPAAAQLTAAVLCIVALWDQVPRTPAPGDTAAIARQIAADRDFVARMEAALPPDAMVFQLPIMEFPESPAPGVPPYDHFRPYLFAKNLRFSYGSMKGRQREQWQQELAKVPLDKAVERLKELGFAAVYINRNAFPERGRQIVEQLEAGRTKPRIESEAGDLVCVPLD